MKILISISPEPVEYLLVVQPNTPVKLIRLDTDEKDDKASNDYDLILTTDYDTLIKLFDGTMSPLTAAGRANIKDPAPLDFKLPKGRTLDAVTYRNLITFIQRFFNRFEPETITMKENNSRVVHGGHAVALYYDKGFRSSWFLVKKGDQLNEPNDTNNFPQAFIVTSGEGFLDMGKGKMLVEEGKSYFIPPESQHVITTKGQMTLIWLAWGENA